MSKIKVLNELYRYTEAFKKESANSLIRRYIFKDKNSKEPGDGSLSFIDSDMLYDGNFEKIPEPRTYFKYKSINGRFLNKNVRVTNIPVGVLDKDAKTIINALSSCIKFVHVQFPTNANKTAYKRLTLAKDSDDYKRLVEEHPDDLEILMEGSLKEIYAKLNSEKEYNHYNLQGLYPDIFGKQFSAKEFSKATGIMISIYKIVKNPYFSYSTYKISTEEKNIKMSIMSSTYFDIEFTDDNKNSEYYIMEIIKPFKDYECKYTANTEEIDSNSIRFKRIGGNYSFESRKPFIWGDTEDDAQGATREIYTFDPDCVKANTEISVDIHLHNTGGHSYETDPFTIDLSKIYDESDDRYQPFIDYLNGRYIDNSQLLLWCISSRRHYIDSIHYEIITTSNMILPSWCKQNGNTIEISIPEKYLYYNYDKIPPEEITTTVTLAITVLDSGLFSTNTERNINDILESYGLEREEEIPDSPADENLLTYYPEFFRHQLERQCKSFTGEINKIRKDSIIYYLKDDAEVTDYTPCIIFEFPIKHSSVMIFKDGNLISPFTYFEGVHQIKKINGDYVEEVELGEYGNMYMYINLNDLIDESELSQFLNDPDKTLISLSSTLRIICTNTLFEEDVRFPLYMIKKYVPINSTRYSYMYDDETEHYGYVEDTEGIYVKYDEDGEYYQVQTDKRYTRELNELTINQTIGGEDVTETVYKENYIEDENGEYYAVLTNEYIIPANKNLDLQNLAIVAENLVEYNYDDFDADGNKYAVDSEEGLYCSAMVKTSEPDRVKRFIKYGSFVIPETPEYVLYQDTRYLKTKFNNNSESFSYDDTNEDNYMYVKCKGDNVIRYSRVHYKYYSLMNNIKYSTIKGDRNLFVKDPVSGEFFKYKPSDDLATQFMKYNKMIKIKISGGEIIDCGLPPVDEFIDMIDCGSEIDFNDTDEFDHIDLNYSAVESIEDGHVVAFNISNGYSQYYFNKEDEQFLAYVVPHQVANSEGKMLGFLNGRLTDEFVINKYLFFRLFDGNTILSFSDDPTSPDQSYYMIDQEGEYIYDEDENKYVKITDDMLIDDDTTRYKKIILDVYLTNLGNYTLYQDINNISFKDGIFEIGNTISSYVANEQKMYDDFYAVPYSPEYTLLFINGKYIDKDHIKVLSNKRFCLVNMEDYFKDELKDGNLEINEMYLYKYDYINPTKFLDCYYDEKLISVFDWYTMHGVDDYLWDNYGNSITDKYIENTASINKNIIINPISSGYHPVEGKMSLYEIFGKYVLNKYDLDADFDLAEEVKSYFNDLYDKEDMRMRLELNTDKLNRKYTY